MRFVLVCAHLQVMLLLRTSHVQVKCLCKPSMRNNYTCICIYQKHVRQHTIDNVAT